MRSKTSGPAYEPWFEHDAVWLGSVPTWGIVEFKDLSPPQELAAMFSNVTDGLHIGWSSIFGRIGLLERDELAWLQLRFVQCPYSSSDFFFPVRYDA